MTHYPTHSLVYPLPHSNSQITSPHTSAQVNE
ncbi:uncharacterized protein CELE_R02D5.24 [Caenorhabditis elegans]|uniref:Uncharacterized protein n=1 Tax=Caenorhabditis elegans TaxID=6239 RepID=U4PRU9_CAEEL|nr:Uncharacterized protein CELE_R02D5.24 [Caenorhabditis elegans]CDH93308.1 Uncharacterized protein CELE_R02D5.24 [Caenorhabditis elegans]|eukprot:NP_001294768.1 Uncharacterized protein CELE_R02D5.24 [Caenorhabditis elegans]